MSVELNADTIIKVASVISALAIIASAVTAVIIWYLKLKKQGKDVERIKEEMTLICYCTSATLDGLIQLGVNHSVPVAKEKLDKYINLKAHEQED